jgi:hypothetical protein
MDWILDISWFWFFKNSGGGGKMMVGAWWFSLEERSYFIQVRFSHISKS